MAQLKAIRKQALSPKAEVEGSDPFGSRFIRYLRSELPSPSHPHSIPTKASLKPGAGSRDPQPLDKEPTAFLPRCPPHPRGARAMPGCFEIVYALDAGGPLFGVVTKAFPWFPCDNRHQRSAMRSFPADWARPDGSIFTTGMSDPLRAGRNGMAHRAVAVY